MNLGLPDSKFGALTTWPPCLVINSTKKLAPSFNNTLSCPASTNQAPVVQTLDSAIHWINHCPQDNSIGFASVYPLDSNLSAGQRYSSFEQLGPGDLLEVLQGAIVRQKKVIV